MQTLTQTLKRIANVNNWRQWAIVFFAGLVMLVTTACGTAKAAAPNTATPGTLNAPKAESMYPYKDTDRDTSTADAKADRMIREANQRIQQGNDQSLGQRAEEVGQAAKQAAENAADNARGLVNDAANSLDRATSDR